MSSAISALSVEELSSIAADVVYECIGTLGAVRDYQADKARTIAQKYISVGAPLSSLRRRKHVDFLGLGKSKSTHSIAQSTGTVRTGLHSHWVQSQSTVTVARCTLSRRQLSLFRRQCRGLVHGTGRRRTSAALGGHRTNTMPFNASSSKLSCRCQWAANND